jgi:hypothetical protein
MNSNLSDFFVASANSRRDMAHRYLRLAHQFPSHKAFMSHFRRWMSEAIGDLRLAKKARANG